MRKIITLLLLATAFNSFSQDWPVKTMVMNKKQQNIAFTPVKPFSFISSKKLGNLGSYQELRLNNNLLAQLMQQKPAALQLDIPLNGSAKNAITCELVQYSLGNVKFTENNNTVIDDVKVPLTYRGIISNEKIVNTVILTVNEEYLSLSIMMQDKVIQVTLADEKDKSVYRVYNSNEVQFPQAAISCGTNKVPVSKTSGGIEINGVAPSTPAALRDKCINVFVDCFDSLYIWRNSNRQQTIEYVYELFNSVATGYYQDTVNVQITAVNVWTNDPYRGDTRENALFDLAGQWKDNFWGNICVGLDYSPAQRIRSGLAGDIGRIKAVSANTCPAYKYGGTDSLSACCYAELNYVGFNTTNFPTGPSTTGAQVYLVMHEMGHLLGSAHTQWCGWKLTSNPDTFGALDNCAPTEGGCPPGPPPPANGGTIMSYCTAGVGGNIINYTNGFGRLPGNAIRNFIDQSACVLNCTDCFGLLNLNKSSSGSSTAAVIQLPQLIIDKIPLLPQPAGNKFLTLQKPAQ